MAIVKYDQPGRPSPYGVKWSVKGKRKFKFFKKPTTRDEYLKGLEYQEKISGRALLELSAADAAIFKQCVELLGSGGEVLKVCEAKVKKTQLQEYPVKDAIEDYLQEKRDLGRDDNYIRAMRNILRRLSSQFPGNFREWNEDLAREWLFSIAGSFAPVTVRSHQKVGVTFCWWAVDRNYLAENVFKNIKTPEVILPEPEFLKIEEIKSLMETAKEQFPKAVAYFALGAFAGIRSSAAARLDISSIDFEKQGILIRADQAKNKRRIYIDGYEANLWTWLAWAKKKAPEGFNITKRQWDNLRGRVANKAGVKMPHNALRHSFCSYHVALFGDAGKTATLLTHRGNVRILYEHYRGNAGRDQAKQYFSVTP